MVERFDLVAFDMDGVLVDHVSSWQWVHEHYGVDNSETLAAFMRGEVDDLEFMRRDARLWLSKDPQLSNARLLEIFEDIPIIDGVAETIDRLREGGVRSVIVSGGIDVLAKRVAEEYGFDGWVANGLVEENGRLTGDGIVNVLLVDKRIALGRFMDRYGVGPERTVSIGNSFIDVSMFQSSSLGIAFNPVDEMVENGADVVLRSRDLRDVLPHILQA